MPGGRGDGDVSKKFNLSDPEDFIHVFGWKPKPVPASDFSLVGGRLHYGGEKVSKHTISTIRGEHAVVIETEGDPETGAIISSFSFPKYAVFVVCEHEV